MPDNEARTDDGPVVKRGGRSNHGCGGLLVAALVVLLPLAYVLSGGPMFWLLYLAWVVAAISGLEAIFPEPLLFLSLFNLLAGNGALMFLNMLAPIRRGWLNLIPYSLTAFGYWVILSIATYRGLWQLLRNPFYWEKTHHGVSRHVVRELTEARESVA